MNGSDKSKVNYKHLDQATSVFSYFNFMLHQLKMESKESFSRSFFIFKKVSENFHSDKHGTGYNKNVDKDLKYCRSMLSELIILLQFEDILDQKFDHISIINNMVIDELKTNDILSDKSKSVLLKKTVLLNSAQLERIKQEHKQVRQDLKDKFGEIYKKAETIMKSLQGFSQENSELVSFSINRIESAMKLIRNFLNIDVIRFSLKIDSLIKIYDDLDINIFSSIQEKAAEFDLGKLLKVYTMESERLVFAEIFGEGKEYEQTTSHRNENTIDLF